MTRIAAVFSALALVVAATALPLTSPFAGSAQAQQTLEPGPADRLAILGTIRAQLDAFQADDGTRAFTYATPQLRQLFRTPENFMAMVRGGYRAVYRPQSVEFLDARIVNGKIGQAVAAKLVPIMAILYVLGAIYTMEQQADGSWRIAAVQLIPTGELSS